MNPAGPHMHLRRTRNHDLLRLLPRVWWLSVTSGRFFTGWTALASFFGCVTVLRAAGAAESPVEVGQATVASVLGWTVLAVAILPIAWAERRIRTPWARGLLVLAAVAAASAVRPFLNELLVLWLTGSAMLADWPQRVLTNLLVWMMLLSMVAIATNGYTTTRLASTRLRAALASLDEAQARADRFDAEATAMLQSMTARLHERSAALAVGPTGFERVRELSEAVRVASHDLGDLASRDPSMLEAGDDGPPEREPSRPVLARLRPPPWFTVALVFLCASFPYVLRAAPWYLVLVEIGLTGVVGYAGDLATRRIARRRPATVRGAVLLIVWVAAGAILSAASFALLPAAGPVAVTPLLTIPTIAVVAALCTDAIHHSIVQTRRLTTTLSRVTGALVSRAERTRATLRHAAEVLHGRVQGRCVVFAATLEDRDATPAEVSAFRAEIDAALAEVRAAPERSVRHAEELDDLIATWSHVLTISRDIDPGARAALDDGGVARRVAAIASEGFVNAVKHSGAREAALAVRGVRDATGPALHVEVASPGVLKRMGVGDGRGIAQLGAGAQVFQRGGEVVLDASVPLRELV